MHNNNYVNLITVAELAKKLGLPISRVRYEVFKGTIPYIKIGRSVRFNLDEINLWISKKRKGDLTNAQ